MSSLKSGTQKGYISHLYRLLKECREWVEGKSALAEEVKHPVILPKYRHVSKLILRHVREKKQGREEGRNHMVSPPRRHYWTPHANSASRKIIKECVICERKRRQPGERKMPADRISVDHPPFLYVGMDHFGPIESKRGRRTVKRYGVRCRCSTC